MVKLVDTRDLKSLDHCDRAGSIPAPGTILYGTDFIVLFYLFLKERKEVTQQLIEIQLNSGSSPANPFSLPFLVVV